MDYAKIANKVIVDGIKAAPKGQPITRQAAKDFLVNTDIFQLTLSAKENPVKLLDAMVERLNKLTSNKAKQFADNMNQIEEKYCIDKIKSGKEFNRIMEKVLDSPRGKILIEKIQLSKVKAMDLNIIECRVH